VKFQWKAAAPGALASTYIFMRYHTGDKHLMARGMPFWDQIELLTCTAVELLQQPEGA